MTEGKYLVQHNFKTTEAEDAIIREKMKAAGITNQSVFLRAMVVKGSLLKLDLPEIRELLRLMKNLTNNVNQMAKAIAEWRLYKSRKIFLQEILYRRFRES